MSLKPGTTTSVFSDVRMDGSERYAGGRRMSRILTLVALLILPLLCSVCLQAQWQDCNNGLGGGVITGLARSGSYVFAATISYGVVVSSDQGQSWQTYQNELNGVYVFELATYKNSVFAATNAGLYSSTDNGQSWNFGGFGLPPTLTCIYPDGDTLWCGSDRNGVFMSTNGGASWTARNYQLTVLSMDHQCIAREGGRLMIGTYGGGTFFSSDRGASWVNRSNGLGDLVVSCATIVNGVCFAGTLSGLYRSVDFGANWTKCSTPLKLHAVEFVRAAHGDIYIGSDGAGVLRSSDNGLTWNVVDPAAGITPVCILDAGPELMVGYTLSKLRHSTDGTNWSLLSTLPFELNCYFAALDGSKAYCAVNGGGLFASTNDGTNWNLSSDGLYTTGILSAMRSGSDYIVGCSSNGVYLSSDNGMTWNQRSSGLPAIQITALTELSSQFIAGTRGNGLYRSADRGQQWSKIPTVGLQDNTIQSLALIGSTLFAATQQRGVFSSTDNGSRWTAVNSGLTDTRIGTMVQSNGVLFLATASEGVFSSTNKGTNWLKKSNGLRGSYVSALAAFADNVICATEDGIFLSTNRGEQWFEKNCGLNNYSISYMVMDASRVLVCTTTGMIRCVPFSSLLEKAVVASVFGPQSVCPSFAVQYHANRGDNLSYDWVVQGGAIQGQPTDSSVTVSWATSGQHSLRLVETNTVSGCSDTVDYDVQLSLGSLRIAGDSVVCSDATKAYELQLRDTRVTWLVQNGRILGSDSSSSVTVEWDTTQNDAQLRAVVKANNGGCVDTLKRSVQLVHEPSPRPHINGLQAVCPDQYISYSVPSQTNHRYLWVVSGGTVQGSATEPTISVSWPNGSNPTLQIIEWSASGCLGSELISIFVNGKGIDISGDLNPCNLDTAIYVSTLVSGVQKSWTASTGTILGPATGDTVRVLWGTNNFLRSIRMNVALPGGCSTTVTKSLGLPNSSAILSAPQSEAVVNDSVATPFALPIRLESAHCLSANYAPDSLIYTLRLNKTMFLPLQREDLSYSDEGHWRSITVRRKLGPLGNSDTLDAISGYVLLGDSVSTPLYIENLKWSRANGQSMKVSSQTENGRLSLKGVANDYAGFRLLTRSGVVIQLLAPNPAVDNMHVVLKRQSEGTANQSKTVELSIVDAIGQILDTHQVELHSDTIEYTLALSSEWPVGFYLLRMYDSATGSTQTRLFQIVR